MAEIRCVCCQSSRDGVILTNATLAYDIKLLVNKGTVDIVRPQWVLDCVARDELVPLRKRYIIKGRVRLVQEFTNFTDTSSILRTIDGFLLNTTNLIARKMEKWQMKKSSRPERKMLASRFP